MIVQCARIISRRRRVVRRVPGDASARSRDAPPVLRSGWGVARKQRSILRNTLIHRFERPERASITPMFFGSDRVFFGSGLVFLGSHRVFLGSLPVFFGSLPVFLGSLPVFLGSLRVFFGSHRVFRRTLPLILLILVSFKEDTPGCARCSFDRLHAYALATARVQGGHIFLSSHVNTLAASSV